MSDQALPSTSSGPPSFENILNFRDVGATINRLAGKKLIQEGLLFRSARPDEASISDRKKLTDELRIKTVIDLRSTTEHINQAQKRNVHVASSAAIPKSDASITDSVKLPGVDYAEINLNGGAFQRALLWKLSWFDMAHLFALMAIGRRNEGIQILGSKVMQPRGLTRMGMDVFDYSQVEVRKIFDVLVERENYPLLVHCTQGKDRTGFTILLILALLHVDPRWIQADYFMSDKELEPEREERIRECAMYGLGEEFARCPPDFVEKMLDYLQNEHGTVEEYLGRASVDHEMQEAVKRILKVD